MNAARRRAWQGIEARHGAIPGIQIADKILDGVTCIRLDAAVVSCHSDKEGAEPKRSFVHWVNRAHRERPVWARKAKHGWELRRCARCGFVRFA